MTKSLQPVVHVHRLVPFSPTGSLVAIVCDRLPNDTLVGTCLPGPAHQLGEYPVVLYPFLNPLWALFFRHYLLDPLGVSTSRDRPCF